MSIDDELETCAAVMSALPHLHLSSSLPYVRLTHFICREIRPQNNGNQTTIHRRSQRNQAARWP